MTCIAIKIGIPTGPAADGGAYPRLYPSSTTTDAAMGDVIGEVIVRNRPYPRLVPSITTTDADIGDLIGTIRV